MITCHFENNSQAYLRHVTVDALIVKDQKILMVKRSQAAPVEAGKFALPGGYMERDESGSQAIVREVLEETGFKVISTQLFMLVDEPRLKGDDRQNVALVYSVSLGKQVQEPDLEITSLHWFPLRTLPPSDSIAFDHLDFIHLFNHHRKQPFPLPLINFKPLTR